MTELKAYRGNHSHGNKGTHLGYRDPNKGLVILCGLEGGYKGEPCRCLPWWPLDTTETTCRECYEKGKAMHDADLRIRLVLAAIRPQPRRPGPAVHRVPHPAAELVAPRDVPR